MAIVHGDEELAFVSEDVAIYERSFEAMIYKTASCCQCGFLAWCIAFSFLLRSSLGPAAPASFPIVVKLVELLWRERGIAIPNEGILSVVGADPSTGRPMNSVFSKTQTQYGAA
jgi:hypothetical protein